MFNSMLFNFKIQCALPFSWDKGKSYARARSFDALSFRIKGDAAYSHGKDSCHVSKNDILFIPAHYDYIINSRCAEEVLVIHFNIENSPFTDLKTFTPIKPDVFQKLFSLMCKFWNDKPIGYIYKLNAIFYEILEEIALQKQQTGAPPKLQDALNYLQKNFSLSDTNIEDVAQHIGVSTVYLRRLFNEKLKTTPIKYLTDLRLNHATELLKTGYYSIEDVATLSGFNDAKYFSMLFKKKMGVSPSKKLNKAFTTRN